MQKGRVNSVLRMLGIILLAIGIFCIVSPASVNATSTTYYINNKSGSNCSNAGTGTTTGQPWCDFTPANAKTFAAGDFILLARGDTWYQSLNLNGSGTSLSVPITLDAYWSGNRPIIRGNDLTTDETINMNNPSYWTVNNLELSHAYGIKLIFTTYGHQGLRFNSIYYHDSPTTIGEPLLTTICPANTTSNYTIRDVVMSNLEAYNADAPIFYCNTLDPTYNNMIQSITVKNSNFHANKGAESGTNVSHILYLDNIFNGNATAYQPQGTTDNFFWGSTDVNFVNSIIENVPSVGATDQSGVDTEEMNDQFNYRGNYIANNAGPGLEWLALSGRSGDYNTYHEVSINTL